MRKAIARQYLKLLQAGATSAIIDLFAEVALVHSPLYGSQSATSFYTALNEDTNASAIILNGIFEESETGQIAIYFQYKWTLKNEAIVIFDVVDILTFNESNQIIALKIIYDTVKSRDLVRKLKADKSQ